MCRSDLSGHDLFVRTGERSRGRRKRNSDDELEEVSVGDQRAAKVV